MIKGYTISNFKAFSSPATLPIKPITLIYGQNSAGKSSILQSLLLLKQSTAFERKAINSEENKSVSNLIVQGKYTNLHSFENLIHNNNVDSMLKLRFIIHPDNLNYYLQEMKALKIIQKLITEINQIMKYLAIEFTFNFKKKKSEEIVFIESIKLFVGDENQEFIHYYLNSIPGSNESWFTADNINEDCDFAKFYWEKHGKKYVKDLLFIEYLCNNRVMNNEEISFLPALPSFSLNSLSINKNKILRKSIEIDNYGQLKELYYHYIYSLCDIYGNNETLFDFDKTNFCQMYEFKFPDEICKPSLRTIMSGLDLESYIFNDDDYFEIEKNQYWYADHISVITMMLQKYILEYLNNIVYIGPFRQIIDNFDYSTEINKIQNNKFYNIYKVLLKNKLVFHEVNKYLSKLNIEYRLTLDKSLSLDDERQFIVSLISNGSNIKTNINNVGFGISQILPVITECIGSITKPIFIEQPELHLHPALQAELGDLFIDSAINKNNTLLIETHSEHILLRIMRRIRETTNETLPEGATPIRAEDVSLVYVESIETDGDKHSIIREMPLNDQGELVKAWPGGFFEEGLREVF